MDGWKKYGDRNVFLILKNNRQYKGKVIEVDDSGHPLVFLTIIDKFGKRITFAASEIKLIQEEA